MALDLKFTLYTDDACENLYLIDTTGTYSTANTGGYNSPNLAINDIDVVTATLTVLGTDIVFEFTVANGVITAATATMGTTIVNILSALTATSWPFDYNNPLNLTPSFYSASLPTLEDGDYQVEYEVEDSDEEITFTADDTILIECATCCCISKKMAGVNINDKANLVANLVPLAYLEVARYADDAGDVTKANNYIIKAAAACNDDCGCGC